MSTATLTAPRAVSPAHVPCRADVRTSVLKRIATHDEKLSKDVVNHILSQEPVLPARLDLDSVLDGMRAMEHVLDLIDEQEGYQWDSAVLQILFNNLSAALSNVTAQPRWNSTFHRFEEWRKVQVNQFGDTRYAWWPVE